MSKFGQLLAVIAACSAGSLLLTFVGVDEMWAHAVAGLVCAIVAIGITERFFGF